MSYVSKTANKQLMAHSRESLEGIWGLAVGTLAVYWAILFAIGFVPLLGTIASLIISGPMLVGLAIFALAIARKRDPQIAQLFDGFKRFGVALGAYLLKILFILLWSLLLIIPGIIAALSYSLTFYIIAEDDSIGPLEAIRKSKEMMKGNKGKIFCLGWRFFGWFLLSSLTLGIGFLWLGPYMAVSYAKFYEDVKEDVKEEIDAIPQA